jgi:glucokinase
VIAAGTGRGQAFLYWDGARYRPAATEGGHVDFAPRSEREWLLLEFLLRRYERVSYERVLSGPGLHNIFRFLVEIEGRPIEPEVARRLERERDPNAVVGDAGARGACSTCEEAVELFVGFYGAQAGNLALTVFAVGGVYIGGGIVTRMLAKMESGPFLESFFAKGRYEGILRQIPVHVVLDPKTSMLGAAHVAADLLEE